MEIALPPLPFAATALEPIISSRTLEFHHGKHHAGYVNKLLAQIKDTPLKDKSVEEVVRAAWKTGNMGVFNNAAQAWNHAFYWESLSPENQRPTGAVKELLERDLGGSSAAIEKLIQAAVGHFGSGWAWLVQDEGELRVTTTANADTPLISERLVPLLTIDVWEHAYYLDYQNDRKRHVTAIAENLLNWSIANDRLQASQHQRPPL